MLQKLPIALAQLKSGSKFIKWNYTNCLFFVSIKRNYSKNKQ